MCTRVCMRDCEVINKLSLTEKNQAISWRLRIRRDGITSSGGTRWHSWTVRCRTPSGRAAATIGQWEVQVMVSRVSCAAVTSAEPRSSLTDLTDRFWEGTLQFYSWYDTDSSVRLWFWIVDSLSSILRIAETYVWDIMFAFVNRLCRTVDGATEIPGVAEKNNKRLEKYWRERIYTIKRRDNYEKMLLDDRRRRQFSDMGA